MTRALIPAGTLVASLAAAALPAAQQPLRSGVELVHFGVTVTDRRGAPITGLTRDDFELLERGTPQQVKFFAIGDAEMAPPLHLGLMLDTSGSMESDIHDVRTAAIKFLNENERAVDVTLVDFDTEVRVVRFGGDAYPQLIERIRMRKPGGYTAFYDALSVYLRSALEQDGQKTLVVYTDGGDTRSASTATDVVDVLKASDVTLYAIGYLEHQRSSDRTTAQMELTRFAEMTGGQAFFPTSLKQLDAFYERILREMAARYTLGYTSSDERADGSWRPVEVRLKRPDLKGVRLRTRPGYYARLGPGSGPTR